MPIGSAKIGVLGAGLVPGGTTTFNASGTFTVPPGVKKVNITGKGGTGNPGNAGNAGNAGNPGTGGGGGASGGINYPYGIFVPSRAGGLAYKTLSPPVTGGNFTTPGPTSQPFGVNLTTSNCFAFGGNTCNPVGGSGQAGASGTAGSAGNAGNAGTSGNASNGLCKTFPGGAGGNAGAAGAAGNGGSGGTGGGQGNSGPGNGGSGGTGGGNGGNGGSYNQCPNPVNAGVFGSLGGGGAGSVNSGLSGSPSTRTPIGSLSTCVPSPRRVRGGDGNVTAPLPSDYFINATPGISTSTMGGGAFWSTAVTIEGTPAINLSGRGNNSLPSTSSNRNCQSSISPTPLRPDALRAGGGGGGNANVCTAPCQPKSVGGGGGGGGRGLAGNAGGNSTGGAGSAATPQTFNCVPVTPGSPYPITVATPGGQIVISWNPQ